jgi:hypothetical protein
MGSGPASRLTRPLIALLSALVVAQCVRAAGPDATSEVQAQEDPAMTAVTKGKLFGGRMWLLGAAGALVSYDFADGSRRSEIASGVLDLIEGDGALWVLRKLEPASGDDVVVVSRWNGETFVDSPSVPGDGAIPFAMTVDEDGPIVLLQLPTRRQENGPSWGLARLLGRSWHMTPWGDWTTPTLGTATLGVSDGAAFVGFDAGEFPGGLYRVELATGAFAGVLPFDVTAMIDDPSRPGCLLVAYGLVHILSHEGAIYRVCGDRNEEVFAAPFVVAGPEGPISMSEAVFGLAAGAHGDYWAITPEALYHFSGGQSERIVLPAGTDFHGLYIARLAPALVAVWTRRSHAASGAVPLLVSGD